MCLAALQIINDGISIDSVDKESSGLHVFRVSVLPHSHEYAMLRITKSLILLWEGWPQLVTQPCLICWNQNQLTGLRLSQATWSKSENLLRNSSQVFASAEHYLSANGAILQDLEGEGIAEIKSLLLQLDKSLGTSQVLVLGALANLALSKRSEILDKSSVNETLKDSLMKSPLTDKIFGLSLQKVQEEVSKAPQSVSVNVRLNDGKRTIASSSSGHQPTPTFLQKGERLFVANSMPILLKHLMLRSLVLRVLRSLALGPRSLPPRTLSTAQEGWELPLPSIPVGGRLSQFSTQWEKRTSNPLVLSIIRGIRTSVQTVATS